MVWFARGICVFLDTAPAFLCLSQSQTSISKHWQPNVGTLACQSKMACCHRPLTAAPRRATRLWTPSLVSAFRETCASPSQPHCAAYMLPLHPSFQSTYRAAGTLRLAAPSVRDGAPKCLCPSLRLNHVRAGSRAGTGSAAGSCRLSWLLGFSCSFHSTAALILWFFYTTRCDSLPPPQCSAAHTLCAVAIDVISTVGLTHLPTSATHTPKALSRDQIRKHFVYAYNAGKRGSVSPAPAAEVKQRAHGRASSTV
jgi:hypothetical protein